MHFPQHVLEVPSKPQPPHDNHAVSIQLASHLDLNLVEGLSIVNSDHGANHLWKDDHISQMGLDHLRLLHGRCLLLGLTQALEEGLLFAAQTPVQPAALTGTIQLHELFTTGEKHWLIPIIHF